MDGILSQPNPAADAIAERVVDSEFVGVVVHITVLLGSILSTCCGVRISVHSIDFSILGSVRQYPRCLAGVVVSLDVHLDGLASAYSWSGGGEAESRIEPEPFRDLMQCQCLRPQ